MRKESTDKINNSLKLIAKTSFIVFVGIVISKLLGYSYRVMIARYFGPSVYGQFSIALMVSGWFIAFSALGLSDGLLRFIPIYRGKNETAKIKHIFRFSLLVTSVTSMIAGLLLYFLSEFIAVQIFHSQSLIIFLKVFSIIIPLSVISYPFLVCLRAFEKISWYSFVFNIAQNVIKVSCLLLFITLGLNSNAVTLSYLLGIAGMLIISYIVCRKLVPVLFDGGQVKPEERKELQRDLVSYSVPMLLFGIVSMVFYWIDSASIGYFKSITEVGFYNAAVPIALLLGIAPELFMQLFFPLITREYAKKRIHLIEQLSKQVAKWILLINLPVLAIILVFPGAVINILFGGQYLIAENALRILAIGSLISSVFVISNHLITMIGKSKLVLINIVIASVVNLVLNFILVPMQKIGFIENASGLNGAAIATLISVCLLNFLFVVQAHKHLSIIPIRRKMLNLFVIALIPTLVLVYLRTKFVSNDLITLGMLGAGYLAVYIVLVFISGALDKNDWLIVRSIWDKVSRTKGS